MENKYPSTNLISYFAESEVTTFYRLHFEESESKMPLKGIVLAGQPWTVTQTLKCQMETWPNCVVGEPQAVNGKGARTSTKLIKTRRRRK